MRLVSKAGVPAEALAFSCDHRRLGISLGRMTISNLKGREDIALGDPALAAGWHPVEGEGDCVWRWTEGNGAIALSGPCELEINVVGSLPQWKQAPKRRRRTREAA